MGRWLHVFSNCAVLSAGRITSFTVITATNATELDGFQNQFQRQRRLSRRCINMACSVRGLKLYLKGPKRTPSTRAPVHSSVYKSNRAYSHLSVHPPTCKSVTVHIWLNNYSLVRVWWEDSWRLCVKASLKTLGSVICGVWNEKRGEKLVSYRIAGHFIGSISSDRCNLTERSILLRVRLQPFRWMH